MKFGQAAKKAQRAHDVELMRARADALAHASRDMRRSAMERHGLLMRAKELRDMARILLEAVV